MVVSLSPNSFERSFVHSFVRSFVRSGVFRSFVLDRSYLSEYTFGSRTFIAVNVRLILILRTRFNAFSGFFGSIELVSTNLRK